VFALLVRLIQARLYEEAEPDHSQAADHELGDLRALLGSNYFLFRRAGMSGAPRRL
jgi:hypothetical protein